MTKLSVLLSQHEAIRFEAYCREKGFKKSTLIARLIRDHLDREISTRGLPTPSGNCVEIDEIETRVIRAEGAQS